MKAVINIEKYKTNQDIQDVSDHNLRVTASKNVEKSRSKNNTYHAGNAGMNVIEEMEKRLEKVGKFRKDANKLVNLVLSASPEFFSSADKKKIKEWEEATFEWAKKTFGEENIIYAVVHHDEKTPHFHLSFTPIHEGKLRSNHWFDGPAKLAKLHTDYAKAVKEFGIKRGEKFVKSTQEDIQSYTQKVNASARYEENLDKKLDALADKFENATLVQRLNIKGFFNEIAKPFISQLIHNLNHYRTKDKANAGLKKECKKQKDQIKKLETHIETLELKFENLGIDPKVSFAHLPKIRDFMSGLAQPKEAQEPHSASQAMGVPGYMGKPPVEAPETNQAGRKRRI